MKNVSIIAAIGKNNELGYNNELIWRLSGDLKFFKKMTVNKDIIMGSNTFYSLKKLLSNRKHIVLTSKNSVNDNQVLIMHTKEELIEYFKFLKEEVMVIGGASIYKQLLEYADRLYLTHIDASYDNADTFFPVIDYKEWDSELLGTNIDNNIAYKHVLYKRKS